MRVVFLIGIFMLVNNLSAEEKRTKSGTQLKIECGDYLYRTVTPKLLTKLWDPAEYDAFLNENRWQYLIHFKDEKMIDARGKLFTSIDMLPVQTSIRALWFMDPFGNFYVCLRKAVKGITHKDFTEGGPVAAAGEMIVVNGIIKYINDDAPDYDLDRRQFREAYYALTQRLGWRHLESAMIDQVTAYPESRVINDKNWRRK